MANKSKENEIKQQGTAERKKPVFQRFFKSLAAFVTHSAYRYLFFTYLILGSVCLTFYLINYEGDLSELGISMLKDFAVNSIVFIITTYMIGTTIESKKEKEHEQARDRLLDELRALNDYQKFTESGLVAIYPRKEPELNKVTNAKYCTSIKSMDFLCTGGLGGLRRNQGELLARKLLHEGLQIRILTLAPDSDYLMDLAMLERYSFVACGENEGYCKAIKESKKYDAAFFNDLFLGARDDRKKIEGLGVWCADMQKRLASAEATNPGSIELRYYNEMPLLSYQRIDDDIYLSYERYAVESQKVEAIHYMRGKGEEPLAPFAQYAAYFEELWNDAQFAHVSSMAQISPVRLISDEHLLELLHKCSLAMAAVLYRPLSDEQKAFLPMENLGQNIVSYLTFVDSVGDSLMLMGATGDRKDGRVENRYADATMERRYKSADTDIVLNKAISTKDVQFKLLENDSVRYAIVAVPLYDAEGKVSIVLSIDFNKDLMGKEALRRIMTDARVRKALLGTIGSFAFTTATYLHLSCKESLLELKEETAAPDELQAV